MNRIFDEIDQLITRVNGFRMEPSFGEERLKREQKWVEDVPSGEELLRACSELIAYSQNANSERVKKVIDGGALETALLNFQVERVAKLNPCDVADQHWKLLSGIRQQAKLFHIVKLARILGRTPAIVQVLNESQLPRRVRVRADIEPFWHGFRLLQKQMKADGVPFFQSTTSLLHLLMHMGYDCVKPDLVVMQVARKLGIVSEVKKDANLRAVVRAIQEYAVARSIRPPVVDFYLLIEGGQADARRYVRPDFYNE